MSNTVSGLRWRWLPSLFSYTVESMSVVFTRSSASADVGIGASGRCSLPEMNMKKLTLSPVLFQTAVMHGVNSVSSRSTLVDQSTRVTAVRN